MIRRSFLIFMILTVTIAGCATPPSNTEQGATIGAGLGAIVGALLGQVMGKDTASTAAGAVAGAAAGGLAGGLIGDYMDRQEKELNQRFANAEGTTVVRMQDDLAVTFKSDVLFDVDSATIKYPGSDELTYIAEILKRYPDTRVEISAYTDSTGSERHNLDLSERRARAVASALVEKGAHPSRITARGFGETNFIASNATEAGRRRNRRVTLLIIPARA